MQALSLRHDARGASRGAPYVTPSFCPIALLFGSARLDMALEVSRHLCGDVTIVKIALPDRRGARPVDQQWMFLRTLEICLYGGTTGAINKLLGR